MTAFLNKVFKRDAASKKSQEQDVVEEPKVVKYEDAWIRNEVTPEEVQELLRGCTQEIKTRGLSTPFLLLPFRPATDPSAARTFIRNFFNPATGPLRGAVLQQELRLTEPVVLCSAIKWCWSRLPGGVVTWDVYELFRQGEVDSSMARDSFATFIPISAESEARSKIIFDYFDLLSAIAAHGKSNGLGGMKLSRLAGWWAFEHTDLGWGFEGGYASWSRAADATSHLFFAYLRSLSPSDASKGVSILPISLKALLASVDYPPVAPQQLQSRSVRVVMSVEHVSPTPFALLRRAKNFQFRDDEAALQALIKFADPVQALTDECKRVLKCISSTNQSSGAFKGSAGLATGLQDQSWSRFQDIGFSGLLEESEGSDGDEELSGSETFRRRRASTQPNTPDRTRTIDIARPQTPSWADFMVAGFVDKEQGGNAPAPLLLPSDQILPPIDTATSRAMTAQSNRRLAEGSLDQAELASVSPMNVDDAFWWVWMSSLAGEESTPRKAVFGRCALVETVIQGGRWLVVEEKVKGAASAEDDPSYLLNKKDKKKSRRTKLSRRKSVGRTESPIPQSAKSFDPSMVIQNRSNIGPDQTAKIQTAAAALRKQQLDQEYTHLRKRNGDGGSDRTAAKTNSVFTLQPVIVSEATSAMKWATKYDRDTIREAYLNGTPMPTPPPVQEKKQITKADTERSLPALPVEDPEEKAALKEETPKSPVKKSVPSPLPLPPNPANLRNGSQGPASPSASGLITPVFDNRASLPAVSPKSLASSRSTPEKGERSDKNKKAMGSRFKSFFVSKKDGAPTTTGRATPDAPAAAPNTNLGVPSNSLARKISLSRKKQASGDQNGSTVSMAQTKVVVSEPPAQVLPTPPASQTNVQTAQRDNSQPKSSSNEGAAPNNVSAFNQGPLEDQPAFVADDTSDVSSPTAPTSPSDSPSEDSASKQVVVPPNQETVAISPPGSPVDMPAQDRWAQIRKNAAERAKTVPKADDELTKSDARGSMDDGETSGEETIESRVARIKARVAELTGNLENGAPVRV